MPDLFADVERRLAASRRRLDVLSWLVTALSALCWLSAIGFVVACVVALNRLGLDGLAEGAGRLVGIFMRAAAAHG